MRKPLRVASFLVGVGAATLVCGAAWPQDAFVPWGFAYQNGDTNGDGQREISDAIHLLSWLFVGGAPPAPITCELDFPAVENGDCNGDQQIDVSDSLHILVWLFAGGVEPTPACGAEDGYGACGQARLRIISPLAKFQGHSYGEWTARWWRWALGIPFDGHPIFDETACGKAQHGPVWFLSGPFGDPVTRECTIPAGKAVLFPVMNAECSMVEPPPFYGEDEASLRECAKAFMDTATGLQAWVEGREVKHLDRYRMQSPLYGVSYPEGNLFGIPGSGSTLSVSDGVWILLAPVSEGDYTVRFAGSFPGSPLDVTYILHVVPPDVDPRVVPVDQRIAGKTYGDWGAQWWKFVLGFPYDQSPINPTGPECIPNQTGPVFFLFGTTGGTASRTCTVPAGKYVFFPMLNFLNDYPCPDPAFAPAESQSMEDFLIAGIDPYLRADDVTLEAELDGVPIENLTYFRATSDLLTFTADPSNIASDPCVTGSPQPGVSDGYWLMLRPLPVGHHTLHFLGSIWFTSDVTYDLTVVRGRR